jgi:hypothetical protein
MRLATAASDIVSGDLAPCDDGHLPSGRTAKRFDSTAQARTGTRCARKPERRPIRWAARCPSGWGCSLDGLSLIDRADPVMRELSVWGASGPLIARVHDEQSRFIRISAAVGSTLPMTTAQGQLFLAHLTDERSRGRATSRLMASERAALLARGPAIRRSRIAFSDASADGLRCVAAPIYVLTARSSPPSRSSERSTASPTTPATPGSRHSSGRPRACRTADNPLKQHHAGRPHELHTRKQPTRRTDVRTTVRARPG